MLTMSYTKTISCAITVENSVSRKLKNYSLSLLHSHEADQLTCVQLACVT